MVKKALRTGVADVKVIRGAEVGSDHYLVLMKLKVEEAEKADRTHQTDIETEQVNGEGG